MTADGSSADNFDTSALYKMVGPSVGGPMPFLCLTQGWIEASDALATAVDEIARQGELETVAVFDIDKLLDHRTRRPMMHVIDGVVQPLEWPSIELSYGTDTEGRPFLALIGAEPDLAWRPFARAVSTIASSIGVSRMFSLGAYPAPVPHTRSVRVSTTASDPQLLAGRAHRDGEFVTSVGVHAAIAEEMIADGIGSIGLWAQMPYYLSTTPWPAGPVNLLSALNDVAGLTFETSTLEQGLAAAEEEVGDLLAENPHLFDLIADLEKRFDEAYRIDTEEIPTGDEIEEQVQQYLRNLGE